MEHFVTHPAAILCAETMLGAPFHLRKVGVPGVTNTHVVPVESATRIPCLWDDTLL